MTVSILKDSREYVAVAVQQGRFNINDLNHWDICNDLKNGKDQETVATVYRISPIQVYKIRRCKCPEV